MADYYKSQKTKERIQKIFSYLFLIIGSILMLAPIIWTISTSLKEEGVTQTVPPEWLPRVLLNVEILGKEYLLMENKETDEEYLLIKKQREGYVLKKITPKLDLSFTKLLFKSKNMPLEQIRKESLKYRDFIIFQEYDIKHRDEFDMEIKQRMASVIEVKNINLSEEIRISPLKLKYKKVVWFRWRNYLEAWKTIPFGLMYMNSLIVSFLVTIGVLFTSSLAAYSFARLSYPGRDKLFLLYLGTMMVPGAVTMIPTFIIIRSFGWLDTLTALIVPAMFSAYGVFLLRQFFLTIPKELEEAATIDGCSKFGIYWRIMLPLSKPALATLGTFTFIGIYNDFMGPLIYLKSEGKMTLPIGLQYFQTQYGSQWSLMMAAGMIVLAPMIVVYIFNQRYFVKGIAMTGLKG